MIAQKIKEDGNTYGMPLWGKNDTPQGGGGKKKRVTTLRRRKKERDTSASNFVQIQE